MKNASTTLQDAVLLEKKISGTKGLLTLGDAASASGLAIERVREALDDMMRTFVCRLRVTESGEILYDFGSPLRRRGKPTLRERLAALRRVLWRAFTIGFKIWISAMLVVYFVVFVVLAIALLLSSQGRDRKSVRLGWIGDLFADIFFFSPRPMVMVYGVDAYGNRHRSYRQAVRAHPNDAEPKKRFVQSVYDFVFGPPRPDFDPFANEKEVLAWLRAHGGVLTLSEIVALAGWTYEEAEERMADYLTRFSGEPDITEEGVLVGRFPRVLASAEGGMEGGKVVLFWDEYEAPFEITGNDAGRNAAIAGMNAFTLLFSAAVLFSPHIQARIDALLAPYASHGGAVAALLGWVPFLFSLLFFLVPFLRRFDVRAEEARRVRRNRMRRVVRVAFDTAGFDIGLSDVVAAVNRDAKRPLPETEVRALLETAVHDLRGETDLREDGTTVYRFPRIRDERLAAERERARNDPGSSPGAVIFDAGPQTA